MKITNGLLALILAALVTIAIELAPQSAAKQKAAHDEWNAARDRAEKFSAEFKKDADAHAEKNYNLRKDFAEWKQARRDSELEFQIRNVRWVLENPPPSKIYTP